MKVVILCGGRGTRLREETEYRPKPMVPIGGRPILWHIMKIYAAHGHTDFILCLGYKGEIIKEYFRNYLWMTCDVSLRLGREPSLRFHGQHDEENWNVTLAETGEDTKTAGRIKRVQKYLEGEKEFLLTYGDGVGDVDINAVIAFHQARAGKLTLTAVRPPGRFGELGLSDTGAVREFNEKPQVTDGRINGGFFVASSAVFDYLGDSDEVMFEDQPMRKALAENQLHAYRHDGFWQPMDTYQESLLLNRLWSEGKAPWKIW
jgi:glucose-1-phosphate cytidylyltransferase